MASTATREIKRLLDSKLHYGDGVGVLLLHVGFGFDSKSNDYKVVRIIKLECSEETGTIISDDLVAEVYDSSSNSWRKLEAELPKTVRFTPDCSTYLDGFSYWLAWDDNHCAFVISFDYADEMFEKLPSPDIDSPTIGFILVRFDETIAVIGSNRKVKDDFDVAVWVLNKDRDGEKKTWTKLYKTPYRQGYVVGLLRSGATLMIVPNDDGDRELALYDSSTEQLKNVRVYGLGCHSFQMVHYVESLVSFV